MWSTRRLPCFLLFVVTSADTSLATPTRQAFALRAASCPRVGGKATPPSLDSRASCSHVSQLAAVRCCRRPGDAGAACVSICAESQAARARGFAVARSRMQFEPENPNTNGLAATFSEASAECHGRGLQLCSLSMLKAAQCCRTGCGMDRKPVWLWNPAHRCSLECSNQSKTSFASGSSTHPATACQPRPEQQGSWVSTNEDDLARHSSLSSEELRRRSERVAAWGSEPLAPLPSELSCRMNTSVRGSAQPALAGTLSPQDLADDEPEPRRHALARGPCARQAGGYCRHKCCSACVLSAIRPGATLRALAAGISQRTVRRVRMLTLGNSVAGSSHGATSRVFLEAMRARFPLVEWELAMHAAGGFDAGHMMHLMASRREYFEGHNLFFLQWHKVQSDLLRRLLRTLRKLFPHTAVVIIQHCPHAVFNGKCMLHCTSPTWRAELLADLQLQMNVAAAFDVPLVPTCRAFEWLARPSACNRHLSSKPSLRSLDRLFVEMFALNDPVHYSEASSTMEGCLVADLFLSAGSNATAHADPRAAAGGHAHTLPPGPSDATEEETKWMLDAHEEDDHRAGLQPNPGSVGWQSVRGGQRGSKRWLQAREVGAVAHFRVEACTSLLLEFYKHHDLPLGLLEVTVDGRVTKRLDACCQTHCVGIPGQGFYFSERIASGLPATQHEVVLTVIPRELPRARPHQL